MAVSGRIKFLIVVISFPCADGAAPSKVCPRLAFLSRNAKCG